MATITYGTQGNGIGAKQQAYLDRLMTEELAQQTIFDKFATIQKALPQNNSKQITFRKWIPMKDLLLVNDIYKSITGNNVDAGEGIATLVNKDTYTNYILPEGSSGTEAGSMKVVEQTAEVLPIGMWMTVTEELQTFHDMYTIAENVKQYSTVASLIIDEFYRDIMINEAGHLQDITGNNAPENDVTSGSFTKAAKKISLQLRLSGAKYVNSIMTASANYGTEPVWARYIGIINTVAGDVLRDNPDFIPLEKYATGSVKPLDGEIGMIGDIRVIENENMLIEQGTDANGNTVNTGYMLILGKEHTANIPVRGKKRVQVIVKGLGQNGDDPLNRVATIGWKSWLGAKTIYPERLGLVKFNFDY